jgi:electron transfer flavoprotein alpha subunit
MNVLVVAEHDGQRLKTATLSAVEFARRIARTAEDRVAILLMGHQNQRAAKEAVQYAEVLDADHILLENPLAERLAVVAAHVAGEEEFDAVVAASSAWARDVVLRASGLLGGAMAGDVVGHQVVEGRLLLQRPVYSGSVMATVALKRQPWIITIRGSAYPNAAPLEQPRETTPVSVEELDIPVATTFEGLAIRDRGRPDPTEASIVASGGRAFRSAEDFEELVGTLADRLGGAAGASRSLVNAGGAPSEIQVGQTGKVVTPELYLALGISGSVQHLAGMKNSRIIAAINTDPNAPIFQAADYGLVGDVYQLLPELIELVR